MAALAVLGSPGDGRSQTPLDDVTVKPRATCQVPRHAPDKSIPAPVIESIYPKPGDVVRPGILVVRITFNVAMTCNGVFLKRPPMEKPCDNPQTQEFRLSYDRKTLRMACIVSPNRRYGFRLNSDASYEQFRPYLVANVNFVSLAGAVLKPYEVTFTTSSGPPLKSIEAAEAEDKDAPPNAPELAITTWRR